MADSGPSIATIRRLFALSGNRCAFPKCNATMALDDTLVGEICHIKGRRPEAARYEENQTPAERNDYENLILLCAPHHKVIDDDAEAYTVGRLGKMKAEHEARATPTSDSEADQIAVSYSSITTVGQLGGIAANNFTTGTVTFNTGPSETTLSKRQLEALENLWGVVRSLLKEFGLIIYVDTVLLATEIGDYFKIGRYSRIMDAVGDFASPQYATDKIVSIDPDKERPFVSDRIWSIVLL